MDDDNGLRDPDQPTKDVTDEWRKAMLGEFTPEERMWLRMSLGMVPNLTGKGLTNG